MPTWRDCALGYSMCPGPVVLPRTGPILNNLCRSVPRVESPLWPSGGGTSVVGGVEAIDGGMGKAIALSMVAFDRIIDIDEVSATARVQTGVFGPELEEALQEHGFTAGHFPRIL